MSGAGCHCLGTGLVAGGGGLKPCPCTQRGAPAAPVSKRAERLNAVRTHCEAVVNSPLPSPVGPPAPDDSGSIPYQLGAKAVAQRVLDLLDGRGG